MAKIRAITHDGSFHADDVFAYATLKMTFGDDLELIRTRDPEIIKSGDIVFDVGREFDSERKRFDHHQPGGAGKRNNGIPYAALGLIWKEYGKNICGQEEAEFIDQALGQTIDAQDNGLDIFTPKYPDMEVYTISSLIGLLNKTPLENNLKDDEEFLKAVDIAVLVLKRTLAAAKDFIYTKGVLEKAYEKSEDKRVIIVDEDLKKESVYTVLMKYPEVLFIVKPSGKGWSVRALLKDKNSFENRKPLPKKWAGKEGEELVKVTGVEDAIFSHNGRFFAAAKSKEGAIALANLALKS